MSDHPDTMPKLKNDMWCHVEIPATDTEKAEEFYGSVFGWKFQRMPEMDYTLYTTPEGIGGGIMKRPEGMPPGLINYIHVEEIEPYLAKIESGGGNVVMPITEVPHAGWFAIVADPDGNAFGLWKHHPAGHCGG